MSAAVLSVLASEHTMILWHAGSKQNIIPFIQVTVTVGTRDSWGVSGAVSTEIKNTVVDQEDVKWKVYDEKLWLCMVPIDTKGLTKSQEHSVLDLCKE